MRIHAQRLCEQHNNTLFDIDAPQIKTDRKISSKIESLPHPLQIT